MNAFGGCTIGGGSAINAGLFFEPPACDYDLYFPAGWKSKDMVNATKRVYASQPSTNLTSMDGKRYLQTGYVAAREWIVDGLKFKEVDVNRQANEKTGVFGRPIFAYANGQRGGPVISYLQKIMHLPNFHLQSGTRVLRAERTGRTTTGVTVLLDGQEKVVLLAPNGKVILSAGALFTPALLMNSGIGDPNILTRLQTAKRLSPTLQQSDWIDNTAVGTGLFDNPNTFIELTTPSIESYTHSYDNPILADTDLYLTQRSGPYTFASPTAVFFDTAKRADGTTAAFQGTIDTSGYGDFLNDSTITLNIYGTSGLKSTGKVVLDENFIPGPDENVYYSSPQDGKDIAAFIFKIFQALPLSNSGLRPLNIAQASTVEQIEKYITTWSAYARGQVNHWSSSCRIGVCVDADLKVIGTDGLYVIDASVLPPLSVNPMFGVMVAAEKGIEGVLRAMGKSIK